MINHLPRSDMGSHGRTTSTTFKSSQTQLWRLEMKWIFGTTVKSPRRLLGAVHFPHYGHRFWSLQQDSADSVKPGRLAVGTKESRPRGHHAPVDSPSLSRSRGAAPRAHFGHRVHGLQSILPGELLPMHLHFPALTLPLTVSAQLLQT